MKYSFLLSTIGTRETLPTTLANIRHFTNSRDDVELVVATTKADLIATSARQCTSMWYENTTLGSTPFEHRTER